MQNNKLDQRLANLPEQIVPEQDLWPALAKRLAETPQQVMAAPVTLSHQRVVSRFHWWFGMAATLLLSVFSWLQWQGPISIGQEATTSVVSAEADISPSIVATLPSEQRVELQTSWQLIRLFEADKARLLTQLTVVPDAYGDWRQQLAIWQQASRQIQLALRYQPEEPVLLRQLQRIQQQQLAYLQKLVLSDLN